MLNTIQVKKKLTGIFFQIGSCAWRRYNVTLDESHRLRSKFVKECHLISCKVGVQYIKQNFSLIFLFDKCFLPDIWFFSKQCIFYRRPAKPRLITNRVRGLGNHDQLVDLRGIFLCITFADDNVCSKVERPFGTNDNRVLGSSSF